MTIKDCACLDADARRCFEKRYNGTTKENEDAMNSEKCECPCHDDNEECDCHECNDRRVNSMGILLTPEEIGKIYTDVAINDQDEEMCKAQAIKVLDVVIDLQHEFDLTDEFLNKLAEIRKGLEGK